MLSLIKEGSTMQSETDILFYAVYHRDYDGPAAKPSLLSQARREYFTQDRTVSVREEDFDSGVKAVYRGRVGRHRFTWSVRRGGALVQQAFRGENGFELVHFGERGEPVSKARFSLELRWESTAYYMDGRRDQLPAAVLSPVADGLLLTEWNPDSGKYSRIKLVPCALRRGTPEQSLADARLGEPRIWAETSEGDFCYCTEEEAALRRSLVERRRRRSLRILFIARRIRKPAGKSPLLQGLHTSPMMRILLRQRRKQRGRSRGGHRRGTLPGATGFRIPCGCARGGLCGGP